MAASKGLLGALALALVLLTLTMALPLASGEAPKEALWPWGAKEEPYPWLDYLANLTTVRNVRLVVLTRHEGSIQSLTRIMFLSSPVAQKLGIIEVQFVPEAAELWPSRIKSAAEKGYSIDVAWGGGPTLFNMLDRLGLLMPINPQKRPEHYAVAYELSKIPKTIAGAQTYMTDSEGNIRWIGSSVSSFGFTANKVVLAQYGLPMPTTWDNLTSPVYAKYLPSTPLIGIADPTKSTSNLRIFEIILQAKGWREGWKTLTLLAANSRIYPGSGDARDAAITGAVAVATTIDFYGYMAMSVNPNCEYVAPSGETIVNADPIAIVNITKYPIHAAAFVAWVLSEFGGQQVWFDKDINRLPINPRAFDTPEGAKRQDLKLAFEKLSVVKGIEFNEELSVSWVNSVMYYFKAVLVNAHDDLQAVWAEVAKAYLEGRISKGQFDYLVYELTKPLKFKDPITGTEVEFTLEYAIQINEKLKQAEVYQALMSEWEAKAREQYRRVLEILRSGNIPTYVPTTETVQTTPLTPPQTTPPATQTSPVTEETSPVTAPPSPATTPPTPPTEGQPGPSSTLIALVVVAVVVVALLVLLRRR